MINSKITISDLFLLANDYAPYHKRRHVNIVDDFSNVAIDKIEKKLANIEERFSKKEIDELINEYSTDEWIEATVISEVYSPNPKFDKILEIFSPKQRTILAIKKLEKVKNAQFKAWRTFISQYTKKSIEVEIEKFSEIKRKTPLDSTDNTKVLHVLLTVREVLSWKSNVEEKLIISWVFWLLAKDPLWRQHKLYHLSDTIKDLDTWKQRIQAHYNVLERKYWTKVIVEFHWSTVWRSFQTWAQVVQIIGQSSELAIARHGLKTSPKLFFMVNNADRSKYKNKKLAWASQCLWARVKDWRSNVIHEVIWVDNDLFSVFKKNIIALYVIEWIPWDPHYWDLSKGSQFRSLYNFPYVQFLNTISEWGCPPWFRVNKIKINDAILDLKIRSNEAILLDPDHYWNWKSLSAHKDWVIWLCKEIWARPDKDTVIWDFFHPDTWEKFESIEFIPTEYLGRQTWKICIWNWSSLSIDWTVFIELWVSKQKPEDVVEEVVRAPIGTRVVFRKK